MPGLFTSLNPPQMPTSNSGKQWNSQPGTLMVDRFRQTNTYNFVDLHGGRGRAVRVIALVTVEQRYRAFMDCRREAG